MFRNGQIKKLTDNQNLTIGDVTTVNMTVVNGGDQNNVVPSHLIVRFDIRVAVDMPRDKMDLEVDNI